LSTEAAGIWALAEGGGGRVGCALLAGGRDHAGSRGRPVDKAVEYGLADRAELGAISAAFRAWSTHPDAFWSFVQVEALGRKA
jgi:hypothetical protein